MKDTKRFIWISYNSLNWKRISSIGFRSSQWYEKVILFTYFAFAKISYNLGFSFRKIFCITIWQEYLCHIQRLFVFIRFDSKNYDLMNRIYYLNINYWTSLRHNCFENVIVYLGCRNSKKLHFVEVKMSKPVTRYLSLNL